MPALSYLVLEDRAVLAVAGAERVAFLQGLVSNDVTKANGHALYAALLTAQGRYLHDFFIYAHGDALLLECEAARRDDLRRRLTLYRLRAKVTIELADQWIVAAAWGDGAAGALGLGAEPGAARGFAGGVAAADPRLVDLGVRLLLPRGEGARPLEAQGFAPALRADYDRLRLSNGVPDGSRDLEVEKSLLIESGFDELNGIDWQKGCYIGQELTARMKYRALVKKRLLPVDVEGPLPPPGTPVRAGADEVGELRSGADAMALALLRLDAVDAGAPLSAGDARLRPRRPPWLR
jgi:tRNA-modifying protein YgfZ